MIKLMYDNLSGSFIRMNDKQIGTETERFIILNEEQEARYSESSDVNYILNGEITPKSLEQLKSEKLAELEQAYQSNIASGFSFELNEGEFIVIKKAERDIELFNKQLNGYMLLESLGQAPSSVQFIDINGTLNELNYNTYKEMLGAYFLHNQGLFFALSVLQGQILSAQSEQDLEQIEINL